MSLFARKKNTTKQRKTHIFLYLLHSTSIKSIRMFEQKNEQNELYDKSKNITELNYSKSSLNCLQQLRRRKCNFRR